MLLLFKNGEIKNFDIRELKNAPQSFESHGAHNNFSTMRPETVLYKNRRPFVSSVGGVKERFICYSPVT